MTIKNGSLGGKLVKSAAIGLGTGLVIGGILKGIRSPKPSPTLQALSRFAQENTEKSFGLNTIPHGGVHARPTPQELSHTAQELIAKGEPEKLVNEAVRVAKIREKVFYMLENPTHYSPKDVKKAKELFVTLEIHNIRKQSSLKEILQIVKNREPLKKEGNELIKNGKDKELVKEAIDRFESIRNSTKALKNPQNYDPESVSWANAIICNSKILNLTEKSSLSDILKVIEEQEALQKQRNKSI